MKEMHNVGIDFEILYRDQHMPVGWNKFTGYMVFDVKIDSKRKARWLLDGHRNPYSLGFIYAGVLFRESTRIEMTYAALNGLDVVTDDIRNSYAQAASSHNDYIVYVPEFLL